MITPELYEAANGFSNKFAGWGGEDVNMAKRLTLAFTRHRLNRTKSYSTLNGRFRELYHARIRGLDQSEQFRRNIANVNDFQTGLSDVAYNLLNVTTSSLRDWNVTRLLIEPL